MILILTRHILPLLKLGIILIKRKNSYDPEVSKRVSEITDQDFTRLPDFFEREKIQKMSLNYHCFQQLPLDLFLRLWMLKQIVVHLEKVRSAKVSMLTLTVKDCRVRKITRRNWIRCPCSWRI